MENRKVAGIIQDDEKIMKHITIQIDFKLYVNFKPCKNE